MVAPRQWTWASFLMDVPVGFVRNVAVGVPRARRGVLKHVRQRSPPRAVVAAARMLACLFW